MQSLKKVADPTNITSILLVSIITKSLIFGMSIAEAVAIVALAGVFALNVYLNRKDTEWKEKTDQEVREMKVALETLHGQLSMVRNQLGVRKSNEQASKEYIRRF